jgi:outer membrane protein TolC
MSNQVASGRHIMGTRKVQRKIHWHVLGVGLALLVTIVSPAAAQTQSAQTPGALTLATLVAQAEQRNPAIVAARQAVVAAGAAVALARAGRGVTLTATGSAGVAGNGTTAADSTFGSSASVVASYTVYDSGKTASAIQQAEAGLRSAQAALEITRQDTALAVGQAYITLLRAERTVALQQQQVARNRELVRMAQGQVDAGVKARSDLVSAQAGLAAAESDLIAALNGVDLAKASLNVAVGQDPTAAVAAAPAPETPRVTVTQTDLARLTAQRPELRRAQADVDAADAAVRLAQAGGGLQVALSGAATQAFAPSAKTSYSIVTGVSFPLSDAGRTAAGVAQAAANLQAAQARLDSARLTALQDGVSALLTVSSAAGAVSGAHGRAWPWPRNPCGWRRAGTPPGWRRSSR